VRAKCREVSVLEGGLVCQLPPEHTGWHRDGVFAWDAKNPPRRKLSPAEIVRAAAGDDWRIRTFAEIYGRGV